jgi:hypothetical protein
MFVVKNAGAFPDSLAASPNFCGANNPLSVLSYPLSIEGGLKNSNPFSIMLLAR